MRTRGVRLHSCLVHYAILRQMRGKNLNTVRAVQVNQRDIRCWKRFCILISNRCHSSLVEVVDLERGQTSTSCFRVRAKYKSALCFERTGHPPWTPTLRCPGAFLILTPLKVCNLT